MPASYFDVDGTLVSTNLVHPTVYYMLNQPTPLHSAARVAKLLMRAPLLAFTELRDRRMFNELLFEAYRGMSEDRLVVLGRDAYEAVVKPAIYAGGRDLVQRSIAVGHEVVLLSGMLDVILRHLAADLGAPTIFGNRLEMKDGRATGKLLRPVVAGPEKARILREHARANTHDLDACHSYSDSYSDVPMLSVVGHPVAVNPDARLRLLARAYSWPVVDVRAAA